MKRPPEGYVESPLRTASSRELPVMVNTTMELANGNMDSSCATVRLPGAGTLVRIPPAFVMQIDTLYFSVIWDGTPRKKASHR
jgi:hypothetical protein